MRKKYTFLIIIMIMLGIYYILGINKYLDCWIALLIIKHSWTEFLCVVVVITFIVFPFYMYINYRIKQINHINEMFLKERDKKDFDMEKFKQSIEIPSGDFIYKGMIPIILLIGLGLKISNHFTLELPLLFIILLYIFTFINTFYYSSKFIKNIINKRFAKYTILIILSTVILYLLSVEEQLFLVIFTVIIYLSSHLSSIKKLTDITKV
ncbi:hypothetical protein [Staphylococcus capitis]|nr:hypothetical protein [Staphylococcus capitis]PTG28094.1 hypothetical protein BU628_00630 [Staphylococcus capitis]PTG35727.1 hypothetical protein BU624_11915 [Staphylococcus capitis]PTG94047.1 hypothetical protein BU625_11775 [Staphylococcus capitis]PTH04768.1 hypothetical protein BU621_05780 [Staphylococcus capitis]PTH10684.1 hypothetical protein BU618_04155 [Staphylococcus capitis]